MSLRTKIHGYTAWINMRLLPFNHSLNNVIMDILQGTNMKFLIESMTGHKWEKLQTFEKLTKEQIQTRVNWILDELKRYNVVANDLRIDARMVAIRSAKHVFELLWRLVVHDIWFLWDRIEFLANQDDEVLLKVPFTWVPVEPPEQDKPKTTQKTQVSFLSGFSAAPAVKEVVNNNLEKADKAGPDYEKFPGFDIMKSYSTQNLKQKSPDPKRCLIEIVKIQLKTVPESKRINFTKLSELADTRVLCGLVNSFVPDLFPTEIFLNDRWCINLVLRSLDQMLMCNSTMDSEDLTEADSDSVSSFLCYLFMTLFKYKQCRIVVEKYRKLDKIIKYTSMDLENETLTPDKKYNLENKLDEYILEMQNLKDTFDIENFILWVERIKNLKETIHNQIVNKLKVKFDWFPIVNEEILISSLCLNQAINLSLTNGNGFYKLTYKETITKDRKIIVRDIKNDTLIEDITNKRRPEEFEVFGRPLDNPRKVLNIPSIDFVDVDPKKYPNYEIYVETNTNNKILLKGSYFMYQIFPSSIMFYHKFLIRACQENELDTVQRLQNFFITIYPNFINLREQGTQNTAAHYAANKGFFKILLYLLENHAQINAQNAEGNTPLFSAAETFQRDCAKLLIEFGADINIKNNLRQTVFDYSTGEDYRLFLRESYDRLSSIVPTIVNGNVELLEQVYRQHICGSFPLCTIRSRFINGSTLLHTSCYFEQFELVERLVKITSFNNDVVDPNLSDYKGAAPMHRCKNLKIIRLLLDYGADVNIKDLEGNIPLHVKCYGEKGKPSELKCIELLLNYGADMIARNKKKLMPIHCAAMQGRIDVIETLLKFDHEYSIETSLAAESQQPASPTYLALINDFKDCALWLVKHAFFLKEGEADALLYKILTEQVIVKDSAEIIYFLCKNGCNLNYKYPGGNSALHYAASMSGEPKALRLLIKLGANVNSINDELNTPLFMAVLANNEKSVAALIQSGADVRIKNNEGFTAFDLIPELDEWIKYDCFDEETKARLKAYNYKHTRDLIRAISEKVKTSNSNGGSILHEREKTLSHILFQHSLMFSTTMSPRLSSQRGPRYSYNVYNR